MTDKTNPTTRRTILFGAGLMAGLPLLAASGPAAAAGTMPKTNVKYQLMPKGNQQCSKCNYFLPGSSPAGPGQCKIVAGPIQPNAWCQLFAAKHA